MITKIKVSNFKSFEQLAVELNNFNVVIGANAAGKSNFIQFFKFLSDIEREGLDNAISLQGGVEYLRNINLGPSRNLIVEIESDQAFRRIVWSSKEKAMGIKTCKVKYNFTIAFKRRGTSYEVIEDKLLTTCNVLRLDRENGKLKEKETIGTGEIVFTNNHGKIDVQTKFSEGISIKREDIIPPMLKDEKIGTKSLLIEVPYIIPFILRSAIPFYGISLYDFDPKLPKKAIPITGKTELQEDGSNLSIVLKDIIKDSEKERKFSNLIREILPFVIKLEVEKIVDKSLIFKLKEKYTEKQFIPASLISDGSINITCLIIALYFGKMPITVIEEPERNIHPYLISKIIGLMKEASSKKQIISTTHNPEVVKYAGLESLLLVSRDKSGFSTIYRPKEKDSIKIFLKNELGIEDLYIQNLLEF